MPTSGSQAGAEVFSLPRRTGLNWPTAIAVAAIHAGAIAALPARARQVIVLHDIEGYTHEEIGGFLGIAVGTSKSTLFDARRAAQRFLKPEH